MISSPNLPESSDTEMRAKTPDEIGKEAPEKQRVPELQFRRAKSIDFARVASGVRNERCIVHFIWPDNHSECYAPNRHQNWVD